MDAKSAPNAADNLVDYLSKIHRIANAAVLFVPTHSRWTFYNKINDFAFSFYTASQFNLSFSWWLFKWLIFKFVIINMQIIGPHSKI